MFSPRLLVFFALTVFVAAYPASDDAFPITTITETDVEDSSPWFRFPSFPNIFAPFTKLFSSFATNFAPRIDTDDNEMRVIVNVKDYKKDDLKVKVKGDFIFVQGSHETKQDDHDLFSSQFFHTYSLPYNASASAVTASITSDGYLVVTAPLDGGDDKEKSNPVDREVPITETGEPLKKEEDKVEKVDEAVPAVAPLEIDEASGTTELPTTSADNEDRKEPTTPSDREEVTVQDNSIPNNEVNEVNGANEIQP